jgi:4-amino-4-deoxychorismate lyase
MKKSTVFFNNKFMPADEAMLPALSKGVMYGFGLFETMRYCNGKVLYLREHIERIKKGGRSLNISMFLRISDINDTIKKLTCINRLKDSRIKLLVWKDKDKAQILISAVKYAPYPKQKYRAGFKACISSLRHDADSFLSGIKSINRILYELSFQEAVDTGNDEAIILNSHGFVTEACRSNVFFVNEREIFTPSLECGCLPGITRQVIEDITKKHKQVVFEGKFTIEDLYKAKEAFLTNSMMGVMPLVVVGNRVIHNGCPGEITEKIIQEYNLLLK